MNWDRLVLRSVLARVTTLLLRMRSIGIKYIIFCRRECLLIVSKLINLKILPFSGKLGKSAIFNTLCISMKQATGLSLIYRSILSILGFLRTILTKTSIWTTLKFIEISPNLLELWIKTDCKHFLKGMRACRLQNSCMEVTIQLQVMW